MDVRIDQRHKAIGTRSLHQRRADIGGTFGLVGGGGEIEMQGFSPFLDRHMDAHRPLQVDAVVVDKTFRFETSVAPVGDRGAIRARAFSNSRS